MNDEVTKEEEKNGLDERSGYIRSNDEKVLKSDYLLTRV